MPHDSRTFNDFHENRLNKVQLLHYMRLRNIGRAECIVCLTNPTVGSTSALPAHYVPPLLIPSGADCMGTGGTCPPLLQMAGHGGHRE